VRYALIPGTVNFNSIPRANRHWRPKQNCLLIPLAFMPYQAIAYGAKCHAIFMDDFLPSFVRSGHGAISKLRRLNASAQASRVASWSRAAKRKTKVRAPASMYFSIQSITSSQEPLTQSIAFATAS
jgi:hypothetical protein